MSNCEKKLTSLEIYDILFYKCCNSAKKNGVATLNSEVSYR